MELVRGCDGATVRGGAGCDRTTVLGAFYKSTAPARANCDLAPSHLAPSNRRTVLCAGFTLIELLIVMSLIVILAGIGLAVHANSQTRAREAVLKENLFRMRDAIDQHYADKNTYPPSLDALVTEKYLRAIPEDPFTGSNTTWQVTMSEIDAANPAAQPGVFDVKSGSEGRALDGTMYADW